MIKLKKASPTDIPIIANLAKEIWNKHYPEIIGQQQIDYMLDKFYSEEALKAQLNEGQDFYLVMDEEVALGYVSMSQKAPSEYFLHKFYINQNQQKKGLGTIVLNQLLALYPSAKTVRLTVNRQNYKSINFYFKNGFTIEKTIDIPIGEGFVMDDFQMMLKLN